MNTRRLGDCSFASSVMLTLLLALLGSGMAVAQTGADPETSLHFGPVPGFTTALNEAPSDLLIPLGNQIPFKIVRRWEEGESVQWEGQSLIWADGENALYEFNQVGEFGIACTILPGGERIECAISVRAFEPEDLAYTYDAGEVLTNVHEDATNVETVARYFHPDSIATVQWVSQDQLVTSVEKAILFSARAIPPRGAGNIRRPGIRVDGPPSRESSLIEWRVDGQAVGVADASFSSLLPGVHAVEVGPPGLASSFTLMTYEIEITSDWPYDSPPENAQVTYNATTNPPGFEHLVNWLAATKHGTAEPTTGYGRDFTTTYSNTLGAHQQHGRWRWVGVRGDDNSVGIDEIRKQEKTCPCCDEKGGNVIGNDPTAPVCGTDYVADPVYLFSGEFFESVVDLRIPGRGENDFIWARKYRSKIGPSTPLGNGWDYSYNIRVEAQGPNLVLFDGNTRQDVYVPGGDGAWTARGFFRRFTQELDGTLTLTFAGQTLWTFSALDHPVAPGVITSIVDRNGNVLVFNYDAQGRLSQVIDSLDRPIHIAYNSDGFIASVTDFANRSVRYEYYADGDADGSAGDLRSAITPRVLAEPDFPIPAGHEYPDGKATVYTYTTGFIDDRLNHNMTSITDPKGQTYTRIFYNPTEDPANVQFDRVMSEDWGDPGDVFHFSYDVMSPAAVNNFATTRAIVNDRVGNVKEYFYDENNRNVILREYTGRWDPDAPTTVGDLGSPDFPKLRAVDPDFFETRYEYNTNDLPLRIIYPNLNEEVYVYDTANPDPRMRSNVLMHCRTPGPLAADQGIICETFEYLDDFGGCCGFNYVTRHTDARGNVTTHTYDLITGNREHTTHRDGGQEDFTYNTFGQMTSHTLPNNGSSSRRTDEYTYYGAGPQRGYLQDQIIDQGGFSLTTTSEYDIVGNIIRTIDPRGHDTLYVRNQLNQVVRSISREVEIGAVRYLRDTFYDPNDNVVRTDIQNVDETDALQPNTHFTTIYEYEILNRLIRQCEEVGDYSGAFGGTQEVPVCDWLPADQFITTEFAYDANRNRTLVSYGEAVEMRQPTNTLTTLYDERDLTFQTVRAAGDPLVSTDQYDFDANKNTVRVTQGLEGVAPRVTTSSYDGYDRRVSSTDPMGNVTRFHYYPNSNLGGEIGPENPGVFNPFAIQTSGELIDAQGVAGNIRLSESMAFYDPMDRPVRQDTQFFDTETQTPILDGLSSALTAWSQNSQALQVTNDNNHASFTTYDTANRVLIETDALGNTVEYLYDANSNVTRIIEIELSDLGAPAQVFLTHITYDGLDRTTSTTDNIGNVNRSLYDSRDNLTRTDDALGNRTRYVYDGINRLITTVYDLNDGVAAAGTPSDDCETPNAEPDIVTRQTWDDTSRLTSQTDDNANGTHYAYDALNRMVSETYADSTVHLYAYDAHDNRIHTMDANLSETECVYDLNNRLISKSVIPGPTVSDDTTLETYAFDGLSRVVEAADDDSVVVRAHDSLSHVTSETLNGQTTTCVFDGVGNQTQCIYPSGRTIDCAFDELERMKVVSDASTGLIAEYDYIGPGRVERRGYGNGTRAEYTYDGFTGAPAIAGDFAVKRIVRTSHTRIADTSVIDDRTYTWDRMYNKTRREDIRAGGPRLRHDYTYDSIYRLEHTLVTDQTDPLDPVQVRDTWYTLDGVGNRLEVTGEIDPGTYALDSTAPLPADCPVNQYTDTPFDSREYDENGNLVRILAVTGDLDANGVLDIMDLQALLSLMQPDLLLRGGSAGSGGGARRGPGRADVNADGLVDALDVQDLITRILNSPAPGAPGGNGAGAAAAVAAEIMYDYRNQMVEFNDLILGQRHTYAYDALGRRIRRTVDADAAAAGPDETRYFYCGWQVHEEQNELGAEEATYVYGLYIDEALTMRRAGSDFYYHTDELYNVMALTDAAGAVVERYEYADYGQPVNPDDPTVAVEPPGDPSGVGNPYLFTGRRLDTETGWYYYRTRYLDPVAGRFTTRDTIGVWGDLGNHGNGFTLAGSNPESRSDPYGLSQTDTSPSGQSGAETEVVYTRKGHTFKGKRIKKGGTPCRKGPRARDAIICRLDLGTPLKVLGATKLYYKVRCCCKIGYVYKGYTSKEPPKKEPVDRDILPQRTSSESIRVLGSKG